MRHLPILSLVLVPLAIACGEKKSSLAFKGPDPASPSEVPPVTVTSDAVTRAHATCALPHGSIDEYSNVDGLISRLSHHWLYCGNQVAYLDGVAGVEFTSDGHMFWLEKDDTGAVVRGTGISRVASYDIQAPFDSQYNNNSYQITAWYPDRSQTDTYASFESGPARMQLVGFDGAFVSLDP
jgi:hypothetical protein